jgi:GT2 family glycosyltransferase
LQRLCAIVLSYENEDTVVAAVDSLLAQDVPVEVVVSHSGGGRTPELLREQRPSVPVVSCETRRLPGAARNAGSRATSAPYVSFLAADCEALPGWAAGRLRRHLDGQEAVASAIEPPRRGLSALAAYLLQASPRLPNVETPPLLRSGVSYSRELLERYGPFPEGYVAGEDCAVNDRILDAGIDIALAPEVRIAHRYPSSPPALVRDQFVRGAIRADIYAGARRLQLVVGALLSPVLALRRAAAPGSPISATRLAAATPLLLLGGLVTAAGAASGGTGATAGPELNSLRRRTFMRRSLRLRRRRPACREALATASG